MKDTSPRPAAAVKVKRHRDGIATKLNRIEASVEVLRAAMQCVLAELQRAQQGERYK